MHFLTAYEDLVALNSGSIFEKKDIAVGAAVQDKVSFLRLYYNYTDPYIYPYLTAIVDVKDGYVRGITWDDSCLFCGADQCNEITYNYNGIKQSQGSSGQPTKGCRISESECNIFDAERDPETGEKTNTVCDLTIYIVWTGTDSKGVAFQSSAFRFSQFPPQEIRDRLSQSLASVTNGEEGRGLGQVAQEVTMDML